MHVSMCLSLQLRASPHGLTLPRLPPFPQGFRTKEEIKRFADMMEDLVRGVCVCVCVCVCCVSTAAVAHAVRSSQGCGAALLLYSHHGTHIMVEHVCLGADDGCSGAGVEGQGGQQVRLQAHSRRHTTT